MKKKAKRRGDQKAKAKEEGALTDADLEKAVGGVGLTEGAGAGEVVSAPAGTNIVGGAAADVNSDLIQSQTDNAQMLKLQTAMQHENQVFTSVSNVLKMRHDTTKNSTGNIR